MSDPRSMECKAWAKREGKRLATVYSVKFLEITPMQGKVLGGVKLRPNDEVFWPSPPWHYHYAVFAGGLVRDELYPDGLGLEVYKAKFQFADAISFAFVDEMKLK